MEATPFVEIFVEPFAYGFMTRALVTSTTAGVVCALLSCWLVLVGWSLMGDAVSHAVLPGVVLAYIAGVPFALGALIFGGGAVAAIGVVTRSTRLKEDAAIGIVFTTFFALGLVLVSVTPSHVDLGHIVFGNLLGVATADMVQVLVLGAVVATVLLTLRKDITLACFDPIHAHAIGIPPKRMDAVLLGALALTTVVALQVVGVILVVALLIIPGATARLLTQRFSVMLLIAPIISASSAFVGLLLSYHLDVASGAMIVVVHGCAFLIAWAASPRNGLVALMRARAADSGGGRVAVQGA